MQKSKIAKFISIVFVLLFVVGIGCFFFLPRLYDLFKSVEVQSFSEQTVLYQIAFYLCYIFCLGIVYQLMRLFQRIYKESPFQIAIEKSLKMNAILFMLLSIVVFIKSIFIPTLLSFVVTLVCFIASLSFYVLSQVIKAAIAYKDEVDYTV